VILAKASKLLTKDLCHLLGQAHQLRCLILIVLGGDIVALGTALATLLIIVTVIV
jgi:hypothetical protein